MANNITIKNASGANTTIKTTEDGSNVHVTVHRSFIIDSNEAEAIGAVTGAPAANTILGRLSSIESQSTLLGATNESTAGSDSATSGLNGLIKRALSHLTTLLGRFPTSLGSKSAANSLAVTLSTENITTLGTLATQVSANAAVNYLTVIDSSTNTAVTTLASINDKSANLIATTNNVSNVIGATNESVASSDTATSGLNGLIKRLLQRITTLLGLFPAALGTTSAANSFAVTLSTEDKARLDLTSNVYSAVVEVRNAVNTVNQSLNTPSTSIPPRTLAHAGGDANVVIVPVSITNTTPFVVAAASNTEKWAVFGAVLSFSNSTTITINHESANIVFDIPSSGILDLSFREFPYARANTNTNLTITSSSSVNIKGAAYVAKSA